MSIADRSRVLPLPLPGAKCAVHAVCPVGHLKSAFGTHTENTALALIEEEGANTICYTMAGARISVPRSLIAVTFPVLVKYSHSLSSKILSFRFRPCVMDNANAFQYDFSVAGFTNIE